LSGWAPLVRGALPRILALQQERLADLLLIVDASGFPLIQVPPTQPTIAPAVVRPAEAVTQLAFVGERPYVLGVAPTPSGMVVVGRRFDALEAAVATLPSRAALVVVSNDRALGAKPAGAPASGWDDALRTGQIAIGGETWLARQLGEGGESVWTLLPAREHQGPARRLWLWWVISLVAALAGGGGIAAVSPSDRGAGGVEGRPGGTPRRPIPPPSPSSRATPRYPCAPGRAGP